MLNSREDGTRTARQPGEKVNFVRLGDAIDHLLAKTKLANRLKSQPVFDAFREAVGTHGSKSAVAVRLRGGVLDVETGSASLLHDLRHFKTHQILTFINNHVTDTRVERIRYRLAIDNNK